MVYAAGGVPPGVRLADSPSAADGEPGGGQGGARFGDRMGAVVEDRGGEHGAGMTLDDAGDEVVEIADAAAGTRSASFAPVPCMYELGSV